MPKKILFIEDEGALQKAMTRIIQDAGYTVLSALDGEAGFALAKKEMPDLILSDIILPKKDGLKVIESLKKDAATSHIPVIILSNLEDSENIQKAIELGASSYLVKTNYTLDEVLARIRQTLGE